MIVVLRYVSRYDSGVIEIEIDDNDNIVEAFYKAKNILEIKYPKECVNIKLIKSV